MTMAGSEAEGKGVVIPFRAARLGLWAAQREWMQASGGPLQNLMDEIVEELDLAERGLEAVQAALHDTNPGGR